MLPKRWTLWQPQKPPVHLIMLFWVSCSFYLFFAVGVYVLCKKDRADYFHSILLYLKIKTAVFKIQDYSLLSITIAYISEHAWNGLSMVLFGLSSSIGVSLMNSSAPKIPHYYTHFRSKNFVGKKNAQIQGKSAVHPIGLTSILTQYMGIFLRQNRVCICALWLGITVCSKPF